MSTERNPLLDTPFFIYNYHLSHSVDYFGEHDPQLSALQHMPFAYKFPLVQTLPNAIPGIYTLGGGRQIGKSTLLKQWMMHLMCEKNITPAQIVFLTGDLIDDYHQLLNILSKILEKFSSAELSFIIIDEITYIKDWDKGIKFLADSGQLRQNILMLSGSDLTILQEARMRFPGRRGVASQVDFHLYPLSFSEYVNLTEKSLELQNSSWLLNKFNAYLQHGGYLTAINDLARFNTIRPATLTTYSDWIRGDMLKRNKQEIYLQEICSGVIKHYASQISWNNLAKSLSIEHHKTVADYMELLSRMGAIFIQSALQEDKLTAAPKKAKKIFFNDPFVYHAIYSWLSPNNDPYVNQILPATQNPILAAQLVETVVINHFQRKYPTYYIKAEGEIDVAYIKDNRYWPIEVKWRNQLRPKELKQLTKYPNAQIWSKIPTNTSIDNIPHQFLPLALLVV
jgi:predicted AAA+ superfamily ATPase